LQEAIRLLASIAVAAYLHISANLFVIDTAAPLLHPAVQSGKRGRGISYRKAHAAIMAKDNICFMRFSSERHGKRQRILTAGREKLKAGVRVPKPVLSTPSLSAAPFLNGHKAR
jgi:hypothetical protein